MSPLLSLISHRHSSRADPLFFPQLYTVVPLPLYAVFLIGVTYSALFEALLVRASTPCDRGRPATVLVNALLHVCVHVIGLHTLVTTQVCIMLLGRF